MQLPPTSFFESISQDTDYETEEDNLTADLESILGLFESQNASSCMLNWHYRSRHESLIVISNLQFYNNKLNVFPAAGSSKKVKGLVFNYLPNTSYDRGKTSINMEEAKIVAQAIMDHAKYTPQLTLGVATFSVKQRDAIEMQLEILRH